MPKYPVFKFSEFVIFIFFSMHSGTHVSVKFFHNKRIKFKLINLIIIITGPVSSKKKSNA